MFFSAKLYCLFPKNRNAILCSHCIVNKIRKFNMDIILLSNL